MQPHYASFHISLDETMTAWYKRILRQTNIIVYKNNRTTVRRYQLLSEFLLYVNY